MIEKTQFSINIRDNFKVFFLEQVLGKIDKLKDGGRMRDSILILDKSTRIILDKFLSLVDLIDYGIVSIENIEKKRRPFKQFHAIYFVEPTENSINRILQDMSKDNQGQRHPQTNKEIIPGGPLYDFIHFIFSSKVNQKTLENLSKSKEVVCATLSIYQVNLDIHAVDDCLFTIPFPSEQAFLNVQLTENNNVFNDLQLLNDHAVSMYTPLKKIENVQIIYQTGGASEMFAKEFHKRTIEIVGSNEKVSAAEVSPVFVMILNRGFDLLSIFGRDNSYSSMYFDLLRQDELKIGLEPELKEGEIQNEKDIKSKTIFSRLDDKDELWITHKNDSYLEARNDLFAQIKQFQDDWNKKYSDNEDKALNMPMFTERNNHFIKHAMALKTISEKVTKCRIKEVFDIEQGLLTGYKKNGQEFDFNSIKMLPEFDDLDRVRLAAIGFYSGKYTKEQATSLFLENDEDLKDALNELLDKFDRARINQNDRLNVMENVDQKNSQYAQPRIVDYLYSLLKNSFWENTDASQKFKKMEVYPKNTTIKVFDNLQFKQNGILSNKETLPVVIVFVIGGISNWEVTALKKLVARKDIADIKLLIGGTSYNTPYWILKKPMKLESKDESTLPNERVEEDQKKQDVVEM